MSKKGCKVCGKILQSALVASRARAKLDAGSSPFVCITCVSDSIQVRKQQSGDDFLQQHVSEMALHPKLNKDAQVEVDVMSILARRQIFLQGTALPQELAVICGPMTLQPYTIEVLDRSKKPLEGATLNQHSFVRTAPYDHRIINLDMQQKGVTNVLVRFQENGRNSQSLMDDFVVLSSTTASPASYLQMSKSETEHILSGMTGPRAGAATGYFFSDKESTQLSKCTKRDSAIVPMKKMPGASVVYYNGSVKCYNGVYPTVLMRRLDTRERRAEIVLNQALQDVVISEMITRIRSICVASEYVSNRYLVSLDCWKEILRKSSQLVKLRKCHKSPLVPKHDKVSSLLIVYLDQGRSSFHSSLLVLACTTGAMNNHYATAVHKDGCKSSPVETLGYYSRVRTDAKVIHKKARLAYMFLPDYRSAFSFRPDSHVVNCSLKNILHVADFSRNMSNWSCVYGPE